MYLLRIYLNCPLASLLCVVPSFALHFWNSRIFRESVSGKIYGRDKLIYSIPWNIPPRLNEILTCLGLNIVLHFHCVASLANTFVDNPPKAV